MIHGSFTPSAKNLVLVSGFLFAYLWESLWTAWMLETFLTIAVWCSIPNYDAWRSKTVLDAQGCRDRMLSCLKLVDNSVDLKSLTNSQKAKVLACFEAERLK